MPNQALRIMSGSGHRTYHMYEEMNWLSLKNRRLMYKCIMVYKYLNEGAVKTFWDILPQICASVLQYDRAIWGGVTKNCAFYGGQQKSFTRLREQWKLLLSSPHCLKWSIIFKERTLFFQRMGLKGPTSIINVLGPIN